VSKGSELPDSKVEVQLFDGSTAEGSVRIRRADIDLALVKVERNNLPTMNWNTIADVPVGGWLASASARSQLPFAIGVMSVVSRNVPRERAVLGVTLGNPPSNEKGALVEAVVEGSGAFRAGVRTGDVIDRIDGDALSTRDEVLKRLGALSAGQRVSVGVQRDGESESIVAQMMDLNHSLLDPTEMEVNGEISARSTGFQKVIQHDSVLAPNECGGPIIDVYGNAIGINIARAGRVSSYAIPAKVVVPAVAEMLESVRGKANVVAASGSSPASQSTSNLPASIPAGITIESLKPEVVVPNPTRR
jgi:S1-C subfamily serine protease